MKRTAILKPEMEAVETSAFDVRINFRPHETVWTMYDNKPIELEIFSANTVSKIDASTNYKLCTRITYVFKNGISRMQNEVFASLDELIESFRQ